ncbi:MAG TPA: hypothetical protein VMY37_02470 [Thermoguttaceae bacterium]|nr:hypothetical protein [Thermoguttaceae bacterium]HUT88336.1 hypothetical protein [Thermoguttaceae bacterium]
MKKGGISGSALGGRRALEEQFFHERDRELLQALREKTAAKERKQALAEASGITDEDLLGQLDKLNLGPETLAALSLVPLIAVAWADGKMDAKERQAVLAAAEQKDIQADHPGHQLLEGWLQRPPDKKLLKVWKDYVAALGETLSESARSALKQDLLGRARAVAEAAGGMLGLGSKVSKSEQAVLAELEEALG